VPLHTEHTAAVTYSIHHVPNTGGGRLGDFSYFVRYLCSKGPLWTFLWQGGKEGNTLASCCFTRYAQRIGLTVTRECGSGLQWATTSLGGGAHNRDPTLLLWSLIILSYILSHFITTTYLLLPCVLLHPPLILLLNLSCDVCKYFFYLNLFWHAEISFICVIIGS
jgi:hypothetical protein